MEKVDRICFEPKNFGLRPLIGEVETFSFSTKKRGVLYECIHACYNSFKDEKPSYYTTACFFGFDRFSLYSQQAVCLN